MAKRLRFGLALFCGVVVLLFLLVACARVAMPDGAFVSALEADRDGSDQPTVHVTMSDDHLSAALDDYLDRNFSASRVPGLAVAVVSSKGVRYVATYGDVTDSSQTFVIGSLSKSFTGVCIMQLAERGLVRLDAPVSLYVPEYGLGDAVTVRDLLDQTSGLGYFSPLDDLGTQEGVGTFSYANVNYDLLGRIVERVTGQSYADYLHENVLDRLQMNDSSIDGVEQGCASEAPGHRSWFGVYVADGFRHGTGDGAWGGPASGYIRSSVNDMASYLRMYLNGGRDVLERGDIDQTVRDCALLGDPDSAYAMGWFVCDDDGEPVMVHPGQVENYAAQMVVVPGRDLGIVVLTDCDDEIGDNEGFGQLADGVYSIAMGYEPQDVDAGGSLGTHAMLNLAYLVAVVAAAAPLALLRRWKAKWLCSSRPRLVLWLCVAFEHALLPLLIWCSSGQMGMRWHDFCDFYPEQGLVMTLVLGLLVAEGAAKVALALWDLRGRRKGDGSEEPAGS